MADLDRTIQALYTTAVEEPWQEFRPRALALLCEWLGAHGAVWLTRSLSELPGEFTEYPPGAGSTRAQLESLSWPEGTHERSYAPLPPALRPAGSAAEDGIALRYMHRGGGLISLILLRLPRGARRQNAADLQRAVGHLVQASTLALQQFIQRDEWLQSLGRTSRGSSALVDGHGAIYAGSSHFRELLQAELGAPPGFGTLPHSISRDSLIHSETFVIGSLHFRVAQEGSLYLLHARKPIALDTLTAREREIARALGHGKTFKSVARQYGIAVSTVANHASRIYKKLGIFRREELMEQVIAASPAEAAR